jgi:hypothetical protein
MLFPLLAAVQTRGLIAPANMKHPFGPFIGKFSTQPQPPYSSIQGKSYEYDVMMISRLRLTLTQHMLGGKEMDIGRIPSLIFIHHLNDSFIIDSIQPVSNSHICSLSVFYQIVA